MTPAQLKFVNLERKREDVKRYFDELAQATLVLKNEIGLNGMFQDDQGIVYQVVKPKGKFVSYEDLSYIRTKREGEERGELSVKKAEEAGFKVK